MKNTFLILLLLLSIFACQKAEVKPIETTPTGTTTTTKPDGTTTTTTGGFNTAGQTLLFSGDFTTGAHTTTGKAKIYEDKNKVRTLVFEGFKTDAGPDLRIYMAEDNKTTNFIQIADKVTNGDNNYELSSKVDLSKQKNVLIWCKSFSVLFGSSTLK
jgi:Electron transfer DM13